jgi:hypothetical protein
MADLQRPQDGLKVGTQRKVSSLCFPAELFLIGSRLHLLQNVSSPLLEVVGFYGKFTTSPRANSLPVDYVLTFGFRSHHLIAWSVFLLNLSATVLTIKARNG